MLRCCPIHEHRFPARRGRRWVFGGGNWLASREVYFEDRKLMGERRLGVRNWWVWRRSLLVVGVDWHC